jgi:hypothetical protein
MSRLFDLVALIYELPEYNLRRGQIDTVVEILADGAAFDGREGRTLRQNQIMPLYYEPLNTQPAAAFEQHMTF